MPELGPERLAWVFPKRPQRAPHAPRRWPKNHHATATHTIQVATTPVISNTVAAMTASATGIAIASASTGWARGRPRVLRRAGRGPGRSATVASSSP